MPTLTQQQQQQSDTPHPHPHASTSHPVASDAVYPPTPTRRRSARFSMIPTNASSPSVPSTSAHPISFPSPPEPPMNSKTTRKRARIVSEGVEVPSTLKRESRSRSARSPVKRGEGTTVSTKRRKTSPAKRPARPHMDNGDGVRRGRSAGASAVPVPGPSTSAAVPTPTAIPGPVPTRPNHRKRKSEHVVPGLEEEVSPKKVKIGGESGEKGKGKQKEVKELAKRPTLRSTRSTVASTSSTAAPIRSTRTGVQAEVQEDVNMKQDTPAPAHAAPVRAPKIPTRRSTRRVATQIQSPTPSSAVPPHLPPSPITRPQTPPPPPSPHTPLHTTPPHSPHSPNSTLPNGRSVPTQATTTVMPHTPLGAAAAMLASTSNAATLPARALASLGIEDEGVLAPPVRRFTRSRVGLGVDTEVGNRDMRGVGLTSPTSTLSPLSMSPPGSPVEGELELGEGEGEGEESKGVIMESVDAEASGSSTLGRGKGRKGTIRESGIPKRRIGTRSSGVAVLSEEQEVQVQQREVGGGRGKGKGRVKEKKRVGSPLAVAGSVVPGDVEQGATIEAGGEVEVGTATVDVAEGSVKGKGKEKEKEVEVQQEPQTPNAKGKGKAGRKRGVGVSPSPARRSMRLSGVAPSTTITGASTSSSLATAPSPAVVATSSSVQYQAQPPQPQSQSPQQQPQPHAGPSFPSTPPSSPSSPPSSPPSPPPLRLSLASLSPPLQSSGHKPHTRSPLSASASGGHGGLGGGGKERGDREGSVSPLKESLGPLGLGLSVLGSPPSSVTGLGGSGGGGNGSASTNGSGNEKQIQSQSHTPPGSPPMRGSGSWQAEIDAVDFGTPLPGPMFGVGGQQQQQQQGAPSSSSQQSMYQGQSVGKQVPVERPTSPTSPTERRVPLVPGVLLGVGTSGGEGVEKEREERGVGDEGGSGLGEDGEQVNNAVAASPDVTDASMDENAPPMQQQQQQALYPALIQVEIPPAPQSIPQSQLEQQGQFGGDAGSGFNAQGGEQQPEQQQEVQYQQQQQQYTPPPPQQYWEEPPRLDNERNLWRLACKVRVWDLRRRYSLETIRSLVTHEAHEYYAKNGFPAGYFSRPSSPYSSAGPSSPSGLTSSGMRSHASHLRAQALRRQVSGGSSGSSDGGDPTSPVNFMDEEVYDWEIATSDDEEGFLVDEEDEDEEDYEEYEFEEDGEEERGEEKEEGVLKIEGAEGATEDSGKGKEKEKDGDEVKEKEDGGDVDAPGEEDEEERLKRRRRRSSILKHLRKPSGEFEFTRSPSPAVQDEAVADKKAGEDEEDVDMDVDIDLDIEDLDEALEDPNFNLELSASATNSPTSPQQVSPASPPSAGSPTAGSTNGVFTSFYVPPVQQMFSPQADSSSSALSAALGTPVEVPSSSPAAPASLLMDGALASSPSPPAEALPPVQIPLQTITIPMHIPSPTPPPIIDMPPPRLSSVPVWALRNMEMSGGNMGKGTPVNRDRATEWGNVWSMDVSKSRSVSIGLGDVGKKDIQDEFRMDVDSRVGGESGKPVLRLSLPGEGDASSSGPAGTSASMGPTGSKQAMLMDGAFEPSNQADWDAFLASLAVPMSNTAEPSSSASSSLMGAHSMQHQGMQDHHQAPPPPYSSLNPNPLQQSPPPTPTPPSPASSTSSLHENNAGLGGGSMTIHSPGTSQGNNNGMMNPGMFGMMNVNMMFGVPGGQGGGNGYPQQSQPQHQQQLPMQSQQGDGSQPCFPSMGLTMSMPQAPSMNSMGQQPGSYNNTGMQQQQQSFNSMPSFNMGMGLGMNPQTMNMNVPLNMGMGMGVPMGMPMMQMPMSMPFAGLQLGVTLSLAPHQHSGHHQQQQQQQQQNQVQWMGGMNGGQGMEYDLGSGMGMGGVGEGMFSLVNTSGTPANTPLNSPLSPSSAASVPNSMLGVLGGATGPVSPGPLSPDNEKGPGQASSALSYALG